MAFEGECYIRKAGIGETGARIVALVLLAMSAVARADYWELPFKADKCVARGLRQYSSHLLDIVGSWEAACLAKSADINGQHFDHPNRCVNKHLSGMWGEFDVADSTCPHWGAFKQDSCTLPGKRQFSAILYDIPPGMDLQSACYGTAATINGETIAKPRNCSQQATGMWGEFDATDARSVPRPSPSPRATCCRADRTTAALAPRSRRSCSHRIQSTKPRIRIALGVCLSTPPNSMISLSATFMRSRFSSRR